MDGPTFAAMLDQELTNPLLRGLDVACIAMTPEHDGWWSPRIHRTLEVYLYPGPFGSHRLSYMDERARTLIEQTAARLVGAHEARLLPAPPLPLRLGEALIVSGYTTMMVGPVPFIETSPMEAGACLLVGAIIALLGYLLHALMWHKASRPYRFASRPSAVLSTTARR